MDNISFEFTKEGGLTDSWLGGFELLLNGRKTGDFLDEAGFALSAEREGLFPMFLGSCGAMPCCGTIVEVEHKDDTVIWAKFWHGGCDGSPEPEDARQEKVFHDDFKVTPPMVFARKDYQELCRQLMTELKSLPEHTTQFLRDLKRYRSGDYVN